MDNKQLVEIARSYSQKLNTGNYTSADFFCSQKAEVPLEDAEQTSRALIHFCKAMVVADIKQYLSEHPEVDHKEKVIDANINLSKPMSYEEQNKFDAIRDKTGY